MNTIEDLAKKIDDFNKKRKYKKPRKQNSNEFFMISVEILSGIFVGGAVGYMLDEYFAAKSILFLLGMIFGIAGSFLNIYRTMVKKKR